jgi:hypothetical protein
MIKNIQLYVFILKKNQLTKEDFSMCMNKKKLFLIFFMIFLFTTPVAASVTPYVNFQGFLTNSNGEAITDDSYSMTFSLWDGDNETSNCLWTQTEILPVVRGVYSVSLGPFPYTITFAEEYYIGIQVEGSDYLKINNSFIPITSTWTAFRASTSGGRLINTVSSSYSITDTDDIVLTSGNTTITLPQADQFHHRIFTIKKTDSSNTLSIATTSNETIDDIDRSTGSPITITKQYDEMSFVSDGQNWLSIHKPPDYIAGSGLTLENRSVSIDQEGVGTNMIASDAITSSKIDDGTITGSDISSNINLSTVAADVLSLTSTLTVWGVATINSLNADSASLTALSLGDATIAAASGSARTITIPDESGILVVTSDGTFSVSSTDIQSSAVIESKIADNAITTAKINDGTITGSDLSSTLKLSTVNADTVSLTTLTVWGVATLNSLNADSASLTALSLGDAIIAAASGSARTITIPDESGILVVTSDGTFSVSSTDIQSSAVIESKIADNAITTAKISDGTITGSDLSSTLDLSTVNANTVSLTTLTVWGVGTVNTLNAESASLTALSMGDATIAVASGSARTITIPDSNGVFVVTSDGTFSVTSTDIQSSAVIESKIADNAITTAKINDGTITGSDLSSTLDLSTVNAETVSLTTLTVWGVGTVNTLNAESASLTALSVDDATIAVASGNARTITIPDTSGILVVTSDGSISVSTTNIQDSAITTAKIVDSAIATAKIADNAITSAKIASNTITSSDLSSTLSLTTVSASTLTISNAISANTASLTGLTIYGVATMNTIDAASITVTERLVIPAYTSTATTDGQITWDTTNDKLYVGTGAGTTEIGSGSGSTFKTYVSSANNIDVTVTCVSGTATGGGCSTDVGSVQEDYPTCSGAKCTNNATSQNGWHCLFGGANAANTAYVICAE